MVNKTFLILLFFFPLYPQCDCHIKKTENIFSYLNEYVIILQELKAFLKNSLVMENGDKVIHEINKILQNYNRLSTEHQILVGFLNKMESLIKEIQEKNYVNNALLHNVNDDLLVCLQKEKEETVDFAESFGTLY